MDNKLYKLMDWPAIEEIVYSESSQPCSILGGHLVKEGYLIQVFRPDAVSVSVSVSERKRAIQLEKVDDAGFFAALIPIKKNGLKPSFFRICQRLLLPQQLQLQLQSYQPSGCYQRR